MKYNESCFDIIYYEDKESIRIGQITTTEKHEYKLHRFKPYLNYFRNDNKLCNVILDVLIPSENSTTFTLVSSNFYSLSVVTKYDNRWNYGNKIIDVCNVFLSNRYIDNIQILDKLPINNTILFIGNYNDDNNDENENEKDNKFSNVNVNCDMNISSNNLQNNNNKT